MSTGLPQPSRLIVRRDAACSGRRMWRYGNRLVVIFQERLKIEVKLLLSANRKSCRVDWRNNEWPWVTSNGRFTNIYLVHIKWKGLCLLPFLGEIQFLLLKWWYYWKKVKRYCQCTVHIIHTKINIIRIARYLCGSPASSSGARFPKKSYKKFLSLAYVLPK